MKIKSIVFIVLLFICLPAINATEPLYMKAVSNRSKSVNFTVGIYPAKLVNNEAANRTYLTMYIINDGKSDLVWTRMNHVLVVLKDNTLVSNYNTESDSDDNYSCAYIVPARKGFHEQTLCFESKFTADDIANIYLLENDNVRKFDYFGEE